MTRGLGIGTTIFGETTGELLKPGLTRSDLEAIERQGPPAQGDDPFGDVFAEQASGRSAMEKARGSFTMPSPDRGDSYERGDSYQADEPAQFEPVYEQEDTLEFDGTQSSAVDVPYDEAQNPGSTFSVDLWAYPEDPAAGGYQSPICSRDFPPPRGYAFFITPKGQWAFWVGLPQSREWLKVEGPRAEKGRWQRLTGVFDFKAKCARFFVDGKMASYQPAPTVFEPNTRRPLRIGAGATESESAKFVFRGRIRSLRVYVRALEEQDLVGGGDEESSPKRSRR